MLTSVDNTKQHQNSFYCTFWHKSESNVKYQHDTHTRHVGHIISKFSEDHTSRLFVAWLHLLAEFLQRNRGSVVVITSVQLRMNPPYTHICPSYDVLDLWPAHCSRGGGVRCEGQGRIEKLWGGSAWSFQPVITHHHYLLVLQRLNGSAQAAIKHLSFTAGRFFFSVTWRRVKRLKTEPERALASRAQTAVNKSGNQSAAGCMRTRWKTSWIVFRNTRTRLVLMFLQCIKGA